MANENKENELLDKIDEGFECSEEGLIPIVEDEEAFVAVELDDLEKTLSAEGTELDQFESAEVEEKEFLEYDQVISVVESILFATDRPQSVAAIKAAFKGTSARSSDIKKALNDLMIEYAGAKRGVTLEEVNNGYQLRTKVDNMSFLKRMVKGRSFRLSGPALEVLAITSYKQPCIKAEIDEIRGVESGHLLRGLMERGLVHFSGKSDLPGKPMLYGTTKKFLEIFGLRNLQELPSLNEIDELIPEGIGEVEEEKETLDMLTDSLSHKVSASSYSEGEEELEKITDKLENITTSSDFFEQEKQRIKDKRDRERAEDLRDAQAVGEEIASKDQRWLEKYEAMIAEKKQQEEALVEQANKSVENETAEGNDHLDNFTQEEIAAVIAESSDDKVLIAEQTDDDGQVSVAENLGQLEADLAVFEEEVGMDLQLENEKENN